MWFNFNKRGTIIMKQQHDSTPLTDAPLLDAKALKLIRDLTGEGEDDFLNTLIEMFLERSPALISRWREIRSAHFSA